MNQYIVSGTTQYKAPDLHKIFISHLCVVLQLHDVAEFLGGDLKTKNQHIRLEYKKTCKPAASSQSVTVPYNENSSSSKLALQASILSTSPVLRLEAFEKGSGKFPTLQPKSSMARVESQPCTTQYLSVQTNRRHMSASDPDLRNISNGDVRGYSGSTGNVKANLGSPNCQRPLPPPPPGHESHSNSNHRFRAGSMDHGRRKQPSTPRQQKQNGNKDENYLNSSSSSAELELSYQSSSNSFHRQQSDDSSSRYRAPSPRVPYGGSRFRSYSNESTESLGELDNSDVDNSDTMDKVEITELHLYILTENSPMFLHLRSTWNNCILVSFVSLIDFS